MANALKEAPSKKKYQLEEEYLTQEFEPGRKYMFELAQKNQIREMPVIDMNTKREAPHQEFNPYRNIVFTSQIVWKGERVIIRYYDGCSTIFAADQPKDKETIDDLIKKTKRRHFGNGKFGVYGEDRQLLLYMQICSWNVSSPFRTRTATPVFTSVDTTAKAIAEAAKVDMMEEALKLAREATETKMYIHAAYLGIPTDDYDSGNPLTEKEIRLAYRQAAAKNADSFIESYGNKSIEVKYYIDKALTNRLISNTHNPNKATWGSNHSVICDISGLKSHDAIANKLYEFSQSEEGEEFLMQLKALY
jgi:hypothetical protein